MTNRNKCRFDKNVPCDDALKILMFRDYVHYVRENNLPSLFYESGNDIGVCQVPHNCCSHYLASVAKMAGNNCPYDGTHCDIKAEKLAEFKDRVHRLATDKVNQVFIQPSDNVCPINQTTCLRYQRYLNIVNKIKATEQQNNGR